MAQSFTNGLTRSYALLLFFFLEKMYSLPQPLAFRNVKFALEILAVKCGEGNGLCSGL